MPPRGPFQVTDITARRPSGEELARFQNCEIARSGGGAVSGTAWTTHNSPAVVIAAAASQKLTLEIGVDNGYGHRMGFVYDARLSDAELVDGAVCVRFSGRLENLTEITDIGGD